MKIKMHHALTIHQLVFYTSLVIVNCTCIRTNRTYINNHDHTIHNIIKTVITKYRPTKTEQLNHMKHHENETKNVVWASVIRLLCNSVAIDNRKTVL